MTVDKSLHPCFNAKVRHKHGRIHLPVAPKCNIQCNFCNRKFDCVNESRPGVTSTLLSPYQALYYLEESLKKDSTLAVAGIAGPGDPFANPEKTMTTLRLIREKFPHIILCVASNGLNIAPYIDELSDLNVSHISITVNAVDPEIGAAIYSWVRFDKKVYRGEKGASILFEKQLEAIDKLKSHGMVVKINTIIIPGINTSHIASIAEKMSALKADVLNCIPYNQNKDTPFAQVMEPDKEWIRKIQSQAAGFLPQMKHCTRCRADARGLLGASVELKSYEFLKKCGSGPLNPYQTGANVAVASNEGVLINQHLGEAARFLIFAKEEHGIKLIDERLAPHPGNGDARWESLCAVLHDCAAVMVSGAGDKPVEYLSQKNIRVIAIEGIINEALEAYFNGSDRKYLEYMKPVKKSCCSQAALCS
jgi:nitrogen fixation protein NifB